MSVTFINHICRRISRNFSHFRNTRGKMVLFGCKSGRLCCGWMYVARQRGDAEIVHSDFQHVVQRRDALSGPGAG